MAWIVFTPILHYAWPISEKLGEHAILQLVNETIAERFGFVSPSVEGLTEFLVTWGGPALFASGWIVASFLVLRIIIAALPPHSTDAVRGAQSGEKLRSIVSPPAIMIPTGGSTELAALSVGCFPYPPLSKWIESTAHPTGPWPMFVTEVLLKKGLRFKCVQVSAATFAPGYHQERPDIIMGLFKTELRAKSYDFAQPVHRIRLNGVCRKTQGPITEADLALGRWNIVVQEGEVGWEYAMSKFEHAKQIGKILSMKSQSTYEISEMLIADTHHVAISDVVSCIHFIRHGPFGLQFKLAFREPNELPIFDASLAVRRGLCWDMEELNALISLTKKMPGYRNLERTSIRGYEKWVERYS